MKLIYRKSQLSVRVGDVVPLGNNNVKVTDIIPPHKPSSTGRVEVEYFEGQRQTYFPSVIDAEWIEREDHGS